MLGLRTIMLYEMRAVGRRTLNRLSENPLTYPTLFSTILSTEQNADSNSIFYAGQSGTSCPCDCVFPQLTLIIFCSWSLTSFYATLVFQVQNHEPDRVADSTLSTDNQVE